MWKPVIALAVAAGALPALADTQEKLSGRHAELKAPVRIEAGGAPIDVEIGHAAPFYADFDGDGLADLVVGQFGEGKLRIYRNVGSKTEPKFEDFTWFEAGGELGKVPAS